MRRTARGKPPSAPATGDGVRFRRPDTLPLAARRHLFVAHLQRGFQRAGLGSKIASSLVVGVSGGADSTALLLGCLAISGRTRSGHHPAPIACHVHHHLRDSADRDAEFVAEVCERFGIRLHVEDVQPSKLKGNLAANARRLRYEALRRVAMRESAGYVAVAHHAEDQFETVLMALCRGAGPDGLAGMSWCRPLDASVSLIRPMLAVRKSDCEGFCRAAGIQWREDPSNTDTTKVRARLRREVLPILESLWPDAARRASATADMLQIARSAITRELDEQFGAIGETQWDRRAIETLPLALIAAGLRRAALHLAPDIADELNQSIATQAAEAVQSDERRPRQFAWPGRLTVRVTSRHVSIGKHPGAGAGARTGGGDRHG